MNYKGHIKTLTEIEYKVVKINDKILKDKVTAQCQEKFNENGNIIISNRLGNDGIINTSTTFYYNSKGKMTESKSIDADSNILCKVTIEYDDKGREIEINRFDYINYCAVGFIEKREIIIYDEEGRIKEEKCYGRDLEEVISKKTFNYDINGNIISVLLYIGEKTSRKTLYLYKYNANKKIIEEEKTEFDANDNLRRCIVIKYNDKGNRIELNRFDSLGKLCRKTIFIYDNSDNLIEMNTIISNDNGIKHEKEELFLDYFGNCIKEITYKNSIPVSIIERDIEYY